MFMADAGKASYLVRGVAFLLASVCGLAAPAVAADSMDKALPASTILYVRVADVSQFRAAFGESHLGRLLADPAMQPLKEKISGMLEEGDEQLKQTLGVNIAELLDLPRGEVTLAVVTKDDEKIPVALLVSADAGDNATRMAEVMAQIDRQAEQGDARVGTEEAEGLTLHIIRGGDDDSKPPLVWAQNGTVFHISSDIDALKDLAANAKGREDALASNANYIQVMKQVDDEAEVTWFADVSQVVNVGIQVASSNGVNTDAIQGQLQLLGINGLKAIGGSYAFDEGDFDSVSKTFVYAPSPVQGILKLFSMPATDLRPPAWVPATVSSYGAMSWDLDQTWEALTELIEQFQPGVIEQVEQSLAEAAGGEGLSIEKDIIEPLGKKIIAISDFQKPAGEVQQRAVFAVALDDENGAQKTVNKIIEMTKSSPNKRNFQGTTIYEFELPPEAAQTGLTGPILLAITHGQLFVSTEPTLLEQILRDGGEGLVGSPEYQEVSKHFPTTASSLGYEKPEDQAQAFYAMLENGQLKQAFEAMRAQNPDAPPIEDLFDAKLLPELEVVQKYLAPGGSYGMMSEEGMSFVSFTLRKSK
jgi:hypothetical protein